MFSGTLYHYQSQHDAQRKNIPTELKLFNYLSHAIRALFKNDPNNVSMSVLLEAAGIKDKSSVSQHQLISGLNKNNIEITVTELAYINCIIGLNESPAPSNKNAPGC